MPMAANYCLDYATNSAGQQIPLPINLPALQIKKAMTDAVLADGQTLRWFCPKQSHYYFQNQR